MHGGLPNNVIKVSDSLYCEATFFSNKAPSFPLTCPPALVVIWGREWAQWSSRGQPPGCSSHPGPLPGLAILSLQRPRHKHERGRPFPPEVFPGEVPLSSHLLLNLAMAEKQHCPDHDLFLWDFSASMMDSFLIDIGVNIQAVVPVFMMMLISLSLFCSYIYSFIAHLPVQSGFFLFWFMMTWVQTEVND